MRITDIVGRSSRRSKHLRNMLIITTLAIISIAIGLVVLFTSMMGRAGIVVRKNDFNEGIGIKSHEAAELTTNIKIEPITDAADVVENYIIAQEKNFLKQDGQYFDPDGRPYIAYTFYIGNSSSSNIDVSLKILITQSRYSLERAMVFKIYLHQEDDTCDITYLTENGVFVGMITNSSSSSFNQGMTISVPGNNQYQKVTFVAYINQDMSTEAMKQGTISFELLLEILDGDRS